MVEHSAGFWMMQPLRKYAVFSGRASRSEYWWFYLLYFLVGMLGGVVDMLTKTQVAGGVVTLIFLFPILAAGARRLHDVNRSGWWMFSPLLAVVPFGLALAVGGGGFRDSVPAILLLGIAAIGVLGAGIAVFIWFCTGGTDGPNRFGENPLRETDFESVFD